MSGFGRLLDNQQVRAADRRVRAALDAPMRGCTRGIALVSLVVGSLLLMPALAGAAARSGKVAQPAAPAAAASAASSAAAAPHRVSPHAIAARQHAQAASGAGHAPAVSPTMRRTQQAIGRQSQR